MNYNKENYKVLEQNNYAEKMKKRFPKGIPLFNSMELVKSLRDSGYKNTSSAIHELVDNSIEADASFVYILYKVENKDITDIYIIDDGHGMDKDMLQNAFMAGGTHRHFSANNIGTIGKYGWGHPAACLYLSKEYETYSKTKDGEEWMSVKIDLTDNGIKKMPELGGTGVLGVPIAKLKPQGIPLDVQLYLKKQLDVNMKNLLTSDEYKKNRTNGNNEKNIDLVTRLQQKYKLNHGTITHIKNPKTHSIGNVGLSRGYLSEQGFVRRVSIRLAATYRHDLIKYGPEIKVNYNKIQPIDPLFLNKSSQFYKTRGPLSKHTEKYNETLLSSEEGRNILYNQGIIAKEGKTFTCELTNKEGKKGEFTVRFSRFGPRFLNAYNEKTGSISKVKSYGNPFNLAKGTKEGDRARAGLVNEYASCFFSVTRGNRFIDIVKDLKWPKKTGPAEWRNTDRHYGAEIDFDPVLDEFFGVTVNKQTISLSEQVMTKLEELKMGELIYTLRGEGEKADKRAEKEDDDGEVEAESQTITGSAFERTSSTVKKESLTDEQIKQAEENFENVLEAKMRIQGISRKEAYEEVLKNKNPFYKEFQKNRPLGGLFESETIIDSDPNSNMGVKIRLIYNSDHPFFSNFYEQESCPIELKNAIDLIFLSWANHMSKMSKSDKYNMENHIIEISRHCGESIQYINEYYNE